GMSTPEKWIRAATAKPAEKPKTPPAGKPAGKPANKPAAQKPTAASLKVPAQPVKAIECPVPQKAGNRKFNPELVKKLIRCLYEKTSAIEPVRIDISNMQVGQPRAWRVLDDIGNGRKGTQVYPVKVTYRWITYYARHID